MTDEHDLIRAEGEGMLFHPEYTESSLSPELISFLQQVLQRFRQEKNIIDMETAARRIIDTNPEKKRELSVFMENLRPNLKTLLEEEELGKIEEEETLRQLEYDQHSGQGTG